MARALLILALVAVAFWVYSIVDCAIQPPTRHRGVSKPIWLLIVILLPVVGGVLWLLIGRTGRAAAAAANRAPDDDPAFLAGLGSPSDQDERIRRLEEELAKLDAEDDEIRPAIPDGGTATATPPAPDDAARAEPEPRDDDGDSTGDGDEPRGGHRGAVG